MKKCIYCYKSCNREEIDQANRMTVIFPKMSAEKITCHVKCDAKHTERIMQKKCLYCGVQRKGTDIVGAHCKDKIYKGYA